MKHVVAFFVGFYHVLWETFSDDATGKLSWQAFIGVYLSVELGKYIERSMGLSDIAFVALIALIALLLWGPTKNLENFYKGIYGGFRTPDTAIVTDTTKVDSANTTVNQPATDINSTDPNPHV
jgi:hypothetical protein